MGNPNGYDAKKRNVKNLIDERLSKKHAALLRKIGSAGDSLGVNLFVVGGFCPGPSALQKGG